ncbi:Fe3+-citrate ABC transporter substrate-binding protein [Vibrio parahaemolyticus]|uniref:Fe3+-citrate ABC transporter substrate-binding protein n=4 Tax=Vibrio harveyi group TaxID=717610 RepID=A0AA47LAG9_VIBPH|nr:MULTISPECIES: hypothetical protein [Vibrio]EJG1066057.1 Fe3+-citrate ABC transporter substrate-binding protein [Vibrio parahaemolyticus O1]MDW1808381.1 Fe3+-citrate ABC transporter substrate-binding protein [Vibrio sp. Vb2362]MDW2297908.1 Fe3+-citrate ABC transporter substrate-binding protein [Vibrio sp. 1404]OOH98267.1 Fe3+-citrate ABC transporter substrate-binding protein [Vibrio sp. OULL4]ARR10301.1 Fe3+-citrate ABC transporter substrate-binding protein [Vibrio campbellii]
MKSNFETNTGLRFISKAETAFKIHIHTPEDKILHRSVGYIRIGEKKGLKKAIRLRNEIGIKLWGKKLWKRVLNEPELFTRLPHSLEPKLIEKNAPIKSDPRRKKLHYLAKWYVYGDDGSLSTKTTVVSVEKYGKLGAYNKAKRKLTEVYKNEIEILSYMDRFSITLAK